MRTRRNDALSRPNIGFVFQAFNLIPTLTAAENVAVPLLINGEKRRAAVDRANEVLEQVGFDERMGQSFPTTFPAASNSASPSRARWFTSRGLIVCDEPTSALDSETGHVMELMRESLCKRSRAGRRYARCAHLRIRRPDRPDGRRSHRASRQRTEEL